MLFCLLYLTYSLHYKTDTNLLAHCVDSVIIWAQRFYPSLNKSIVRKMINMLSRFTQEFSRSASIWRLWPGPGNLFWQVCAGLCHCTNDATAFWKVNILCWVSQTGINDFGRADTNRDGLITVNYEQFMQVRTHFTVHWLHADLSLDRWCWAFHDESLCIYPGVHAQHI